MESTPGKLVQIVLDIKGGNGFSFLSGPFVVVASLNGNKLESAEIKPAAFAQFNAQLLWQADRRYVKRLRTSNTALKIECYVLKGPHGRRERIGYVLLNLKEAQIVSDDFKTEIVDTWHKLLGLKNDSRPHCPELLLSFRIEDARDPEKELKTSQKDENDEIQIGPLSLNSRSYVLTVKINDAPNLHVLTDELNQIKISYSLMGKAFNVALVKEQMPLISAFELKSTPEFLVAYFHEFPNLLFNVKCNERVIGFGNLDLKEFSNYDGGKMSVKSVIPIKNVSDEKETSSYMDLDISLAPSEDETQSTSNKTDVSFSLKTDGALTESSSTRKEREIAQKKDDAIESHETKRNVEVQTDVKPEYRDASTMAESPVEKSNFNPVTVGLDVRENIREVAIRTCEELEDWREKQEEMFNFELKQRAERHMSKLTDEWNKKRLEMENSLLERITVCNNVFARVEDAYKLILQQSQQLGLLEKELLQAKNNLDRKYTIKFQELRKASLLHETDMKKAMNTVVNENTSLKTSLQSKNDEIKKLNDSLIQKEQACKCQKKDFIFSIENQIRELKEQLDKALTSKAFFKEQWARAIRELQLMKESEKDELLNIIKKSNKNLKSLGLISEITQEVDEMRRDQHEIYSLKKELGKLGPF